MGMGVRVEGETSEHVFSLEVGLKGSWGWLVRSSCRTSLIVSFLYSFLLSYPLRCLFWWERQPSFKRDRVQIFLLEITVRDLKILCISGRSNNSLLECEVRACDSAEWHLGWMLACQHWECRMCLWTSWGHRNSAHWTPAYPRNVGYGGAYWWRSQGTLKQPSWPVCALYSWLVSHPAA